MNSTSTNVVGYTRVSTDHQANDGLSLEAQRSKIKAYSEAMGLTLVDIIEDAGQSAKSLNRPGLQKALSLLKEGKANAILVTKLDRLTRSVADLGNLIEDYFNSYSLLAISDLIDTRTASGRLILNLLTSVSQWEREAASERTKEVLRNIKESGRLVGRVPFGYKRTEENTAEINNKERKILERIKLLRSEGNSFRRIAKVLSLEGLKTRSNKEFDQSTIRYLINKDL